MRMSSSKLFTCIGSLVLLFVGIFFDQWTKHLAVLYLKNQGPRVLIKNVFQLYYLDSGNSGAAFGIFQGGRPFFLIATCIILFVLIYLFFKMPFQSRFFLLRVCMVLLCAGAIGNMIDRIRLSYVVDFLYFYLIDFPIFNIADIYVTVGTFLFAVLIIFYYKEEDFKWLSFKKH